MLLIPSIDLINGRCVRLKQGKFDKLTHYDASPLLIADTYAQQGAHYLHLVDLDAANNKKSNLSSIRKLCSIPNLKIQSGGGIRDAASLDRLFNAGVSRVVIGSMAVSNPAEVKKFISRYGNEKICLALDVTTNNEDVPIVAVNAWKTSTGKSLWDLIDHYQDSLLKHVLCTDISSDGMLSGPNKALYGECQSKYRDIEWQASGGISTLDDLRNLTQLGVSAAISGKALLEYNFSVSDALACIAQVKR